MNEFKHISHFLKSGALLAVVATAMLFFSGCPGDPAAGEDDSTPVDTFRTPDGMGTPDETPLSNSFKMLERENWQKPQMVIAQLGDISDKTVADIGAGTGYFSLRLAQKAKQVIAIDIDQRFLDYIDKSVKDTRNSEVLNVQTRLTSPDDPSLDPAETDVAFIVNTYHLIDNRPDYFAKVKAGIRPDGFLFVVDFKKEELPIGPSMEEKLSADSVAAELKSFGFETVEIDNNSLDYQYMITAR